MEAAEGQRTREETLQAAEGESKYRYASPAAAASETVLRHRLGAAERTNAFYHLVLEAAGDGIYGLDAQGRMLFANASADAMTGWSPGELVGRLPHECLHHSHADGSAYPIENCPIYQSLHDGQVRHCDTEVFWRKDGSSFPVVYTSTPIHYNGELIGSTVTFRDISDPMRRQAWEKSRNAIFLSIISNVALNSTLGMIAEAFVRLYPRVSIAILTCVEDRLCLVAQNGLPGRMHQLLTAVEIKDVSFACSRAASLGQRVAMRQPWRAPLRRELAAAQELAPSGGRLFRELGESEYTACLSVPLLSVSGDLLGVVSLFDKENGPSDRYVLTSVDSVCDLARLAFEHQHLHAELLRTAQHDQLTGLPNRLLLEDRLERAIVQARRHNNQVAVCYVDLDHFKEINDTLGHRSGDQLLQQVAQVLKSSLREIDTVARQGGDEFILILPEINFDTEADDICDRVMANLQKPLQVGDHTIAISASIGRSTYPAGGQTVSGLLQNADIALYTAKRSGRDRVQRFDSTLGEKVQRSIELQRELRFALERNQLHLVYQPLFDLDAQLKGFEALLRWEHPVFGPVQPDQFVALAEESGLIVPIGEWVLYEACLQAREWNALCPTPIKMFVNVSGVQLNQSSFTGTIAMVLARTGLPANLLDLEITETFIIADTRAASVCLRELRQLGVHISIDDFGCGHSTFSYLQQLPIDSIKIDRSFIACLNGTDKQSAIVRTIVALAEELGLQTVAEGVETRPQFEELQGIHCSLVQGFLLSRPLLPADARLLLSRTLTAVPAASLAAAALSAVEVRPGPVLLNQAAAKRSSLKHHAR